MGEHGGRPIEIVFRDAAANPVDVGGVAVIGGPHGDDGLEGRRLARRDLQAVEAAPGNADHRHLAITPALFCQPGNGFAAVELFLHCVFVVDQAFAVAGAANIKAHAGIAVAGKIHVQTLVPCAGAVTLAVGNVFENDRNRLLFAVFGQPHFGGKPGAIFQGDENIFHGFNAARKLRHDFHCHRSSFLIELPYNNV